MITMNYRTHDRETVNGNRAAYKAALKALEEAYRETIDGTPAQTLKAAAERIAPDKATGGYMLFAVLATLIHSSAWDGRIFPSSAEWAAHVPGCLDEETASGFCIYSNIHRAHLNQLAQAAMKYSPLSAD